MSDAPSLIDQWGPERVVVGVSDRRTGMRGVLVIDNTARGTGKGGTRMSPALSVGGGGPPGPDRQHRGPVPAARPR